MIDTGRELACVAITPTTIDGSAPLADAARLMQRSHVGALVVLEGDEPVGLVTDRDIVFAACLRERGSEPPSVGAAASRPLVTLSVDATLDELTRLCAARRIRRVVLVDGAGALVGLVTADAVVKYLGRQLGDLARAFARQLDEERAPTTMRPRTFGSE